MNEAYKKFLLSKQPRTTLAGFKATHFPKQGKDFQNLLIEWAVQVGRCALLEDCGLGKSLQELAFAQNVIEHTNGKVLIATPLAVSFQMIREAEKFGYKAVRTKGDVHKGINVTNYEQLHHFNPKDFDAIIADEASILKNFDGKTRKQVTKFLNQVQYRLLCTATPAPNDYTELGCHAEALGEMTHNQMLGMFFVQSDEDTQSWRLRGYAAKSFWGWVGSWARAVRKPSDVSSFCDDTEYVLPPLKTSHHTVESQIKFGFLPEVARTLNQQRDERRKTIQARCEKVAAILPKDKPCIVWCHLNNEGDLLESLIPDAVQVSGSDSDDAKESRLAAFSVGDTRVLITKPRIAGFGLNWQHCADMAMFPSHSHEQFYQAVRRCWRFGQKKEVTVNIVTSEAESPVLQNMLRKEAAADKMYSEIIKHMDAARKRRELEVAKTKIEIPNWLTTEKA